MGSRSKQHVPGAFGTTRQRRTIKARKRQMRRNLRNIGYFIDALTRMKRSRLGTR